MAAIFFALAGFGGQGTVTYKFKILYNIVSGKYSWVLANLCQAASTQFYKSNTQISQQNKMLIV